MSYGHSTTLSATNGVISDTLTWNSSNNRWEGSSVYLTEEYLNPSLRRWKIRENGGGETYSSSNETFSPDALDENDPADSTWTNSWVVSEPSGGAQGDPHITPLFGNKYTI